MKKQRSLKALMLSMAMAVGMLLPATMNAQHTDGFFRNNGDNYENRDGGTSAGLYFDQPHQYNDPTAPVGSGLLILVAAGAGYTLLKKEED